MDAKILMDLMAAALRRKEHFTLLFWRHTPLQSSGNVNLLHVVFNSQVDAQALSKLVSPTFSGSIHSPVTHGMDADLFREATDADPR